MRVRGKSVLRGLCVPTQSLDCTEEGPHRFGRIFAGPKLNPRALVARDLDSCYAAVDRVRVRPLGHGQIRDLVREPLKLINILVRQASINTDLAVIFDKELITEYRRNAIVVQHPADDADGDLHPLSLNEKARHSLPRAKPASGQPPIENLINLGLVPSVAAGGE
jgi:hypothetical protein